MRAAGVPDVAIDTFRHYYRQLEAGETGLMPEAEIEPVDEACPTLDDAARRRPTRPTRCDRAVVIKLNGGLGTSMGMTRAKSLLEVKDGLTLPRRHRAPGARAARAPRRAPAARADEQLLHARGLARGAAPRTPSSTADVPLDFVQNKEPKILVDDLDAGASGRPTRSSSGARPATATSTPRSSTSGMLDALLERGYEYAFVSNSDNLGAVLDPRILAWFARRAASRS